MKIRITIEYDADAGPDDLPENVLKAEQHDWRYGNVSLADIEDIAQHDHNTAYVQWEVIP